ncbi:Sulfotransferase 1C4 [Merluccius polli]|uniref:Sulfotransferase n=1 Tax=Merluccius polli TaxID=89951 RepID=A0AA47MMG1_MERPO|nr:Sulfotransferase 1C4 [Merluccius polli]
MEPPRVIKTHLPIQLLPQSFRETGCKVIYVARNPKDNMVSYFHFDRMNLIHPEPGPWPMAWGSWYDHVKGYWKEKDRRNILYLFFEDIKENPAREIQRIAKFLGHHLSEEVLHNIVQLTTFDAMQENPMANYSSIPDTIFDRKVSHFLRKGEVGDWKNHLSAEENSAFEKHYMETMSDCQIPFRFVI